MNIVTMTRMEVIYELRKRAHPSTFQQLLDWPTGALKLLLAYYLV